MAVPIAVLDANVLIPFGIREVLLRAAERKMFDLRWSEHILAEVANHLPDFIHSEGEDAAAIEAETRAKAQRAVDQMRRAFPDAMVTNYERHIEKMTNHPGDRHVAAAAWQGRADRIVTNNVRHFPRASLAPLRLRAIDPDTFLMRLFRTDADVMMDIILAMEHELTTGNVPGSV